MTEIGQLCQQAEAYIQAHADVITKVDEERAFALRSAVHTCQSGKVGDIMNVIAQHLETFNVAEQLSKAFQVMIATLVIGKHKDLDMVIQAMFCALRNSS